MLLFSILALATATVVPNQKRQATTLKAAAGASPYVGAAIANSHLSESAYATTAARDFNIFTPENEMKWDATEPQQGVFNFAAADNIVNFALNNGAKVRGHTFVWANQLPSWVSGLSASQLDAALKNHITQVMTHYKGKIYAWDVVNEHIEENGAIKDTIWSRAFGIDLFTKSLTYARAADPAAKLYINDYNIEGQNAKSDGLYNVVKQLQAKGVPLDGIGFQSHFINGQIPSTLKANLARFSALGLQVAITELDIRQQTSARNDALQATNYRDVVNACPQCVSITVWGVTDKYSWIPSTFSGYGAALLYDENYNKKQAWTATRDALAAQG
ncbi:glycoside hydrolase family 10 protein [Atractiella rhizophila]|nr:glycoside hydrolase family 10 protein [Atractiella rhizophila]